MFCMRILEGIIILGYRSKSDFNFLRAPIIRKFGAEGPEYTVYSVLRKCFFVILNLIFGELCTVGNREAFCVESTYRCYAAVLQGS